jgi:hypothetical protein
MSAIHSSAAGRYLGGGEYGLLLKAIGMISGFNCLEV